MRPGLPFGLMPAERLGMFMPVASAHGVELPLLRGTLSSNESQLKRVIDMIPQWVAPHRPERTRLQSGTDIFARVQSFPSPSISLARIRSEIHASWDHVASHAQTEYIDPAFRTCPAGLLLLRRMIEAFRNILLVLTRQRRRIGAAAIQ